MDHTPTVTPKFRFAEGRLIPQSKAQLLWQLLIFNLIGFALLVLFRQLQIRTAILVATVLFILAVLTLRKGVIGWAGWSIFGALCISLWSVWIIPVWILSPLALAVGIIVFDASSGDEYQETTHAIARSLRPHRKINAWWVYFPGPVACYPWLWFGGGINWWLLTPIFGFLFSALHIMYGDVVRKPFNFNE